MTHKNDFELKKQDIEEYIYCSFHLDKVLKQIRLTMVLGVRLVVTIGSS